MRKLNKLFLMGAATLALGLTACNSDEVITPDGEGNAEANTYVAVSLFLPTGSSATARSLPDDYNKVGEWAGKDGIYSVDVYLVDASTSTVTHEPFTEGEYTSEQSNPNLLKPNRAIKTTAGAKSVYVLVNATPTTRSKLNTTSPGAFVSSYKAVLALENSGSSQPVSTSAGKLAEYENEKDNILMTCPKETFINLVAGVTEQEAITGTKNRATVDVERVVARVMVTTTQTTYNLGNIGTISDVRWVLAQGENSLYLQRKGDFQTPAYGFIPNDLDNDYYNQNGAAAKYDYSGLFENYDAQTQFGGTDVPTMADYSTPLDKITEDLNTKLSGKFILPTTHAYGTPPTATDDYAGGYRKGNTAYVMIRAKFSPNVVDGVTGSYTPNSDFYLGANGLFYSTAANARDESKGGVPNQSFTRYVGGKVIYYAWVNPDNIPNWYNSPVVRNNIYHIHITGFKTIGTNWNPLFPEDPDTQDPKNPDPKPHPEDPGNPVDPTDPLTSETWMSVDINILQWNVHSYALDL